jgi:hypothetical protein
VFHQIFLKINIIKQKNHPLLEGGRVISVAKSNTVYTISSLLILAAATIIIAMAMIWNKLFFIVVFYGANIAN